MNYCKRCNYRLDTGDFTGICSKCEGLEPLTDMDIIEYSRQETIENEFEVA